MSEELHARMLRMQAQRLAASEQTAGKKAAHKFCQFFDIDDKAMQHDPEFGFEWLRQEYPHVPLYLDARKLKKVEILRLFTAITTTEVWRTYFEIFDETDLSNYHGRLGLVVQVPGGGLFIIHNWFTLLPVSGHTRLHRVAASASDRGIIFEPYEAFLHALRKEKWCP